ncbi:MAG: hypothetical protein B0D89_01685, partial [Candidatus Sedimenticola endophacoides]
MKFIRPLAASLLLAPLAALAQPHHGQVDPQEHFNRMKAHMLPMMVESIAPMEQTRDCIAASTDTEQLNACSSIMMAYQEKMMQGMRRPAGAAQHKMPEPRRLDWSPEMRQRMLTDMNTAIDNTRIANDCMEKSDNQQEMSGCMQAAQECRYLVKDFGTSQSPKSTRQRDSRYCPDRPALITTPSRTLQQSCSCA